MKIELHPDAFMWFLPNAKLHLSFENPGPIEIDIASLSDDEKKLVILGSRDKQIILSEKEDVLLKLIAPPTLSPVVAETPKTVTVYESMKENVDSVKKRMQTILAKSKPTIKKEIGLLDDIRSLKLMLECENEGKNRVDILVLLTNKIKNIESKIVTDIDNTDPDLNYIKQNESDPANQLVIDESEIEEREVSLN